MIDADDSGVPVISASDISNCVSLSAVNETEVLQITATTADPAVSAIVCDSYAAIAPENLTRIVKAGSVETIGNAVVASSPVSPDVTHCTIIGGIAGVVVALLLIICLELLNNKIRRAEDIEREAKCPVIGEIVAFAEEKSKVEDRSEHLLTSEKIPFYITESYKAMRTNFIFTVRASARKIAVVTSANPNEGKSTTASNLAISLAQLGHRVLLIDGDLRKPVQHQMLDLDNSGELSTLLCGMQQLEEVLHKDVVEHLEVLTAGMIPLNPAELLGSKAMRNLLEMVSASYDEILIDVSPINAVSDAVAMNGEIAGLLLVARYNDTLYDDVRRAVKAISFANLDILGVVLSCVTLKHTSGYVKKAMGSATAMPMVTAMNTSKSIRKGRITRRNRQREAKRKGRRAHKHEWNRRVLDADRLPFPYPAWH